MSVCTAWPAAWGDGHDAFKEVAKQVGEAYTPLLVVGVPISNSEHYKVNPLLAARYSYDTMDESGFPKFKLYRKGADVSKPMEYTGSTKAEDILTWVVKHTRVFIGLKGQVKELDDLAKQFMSAPASERAGLLKKGQSTANSIDQAGVNVKDYVEYYIKTMQRVIEKGTNYAAQEEKRLQKMADDKGVAAAKRETFQWRVNVLRSFAPAEGSKTEL
eukprot:jgi/Chrzof1/8188/Cz03g00280.t1